MWHWNCDKAREWLDVQWSFTVSRHVKWGYKPSSVTHSGVINLYSFNQDGPIAELGWYQTYTSRVALDRASSHRYNWLINILEYKNDRASRRCSYSQKRCLEEISPSWYAFPPPRDRTPTLSDWQRVSTLNRTIRRITGNVRSVCRWRRSWRRQ